MKSKRHKILFLLCLIVSFTDWIQSRFDSAFELRVKLNISRNHNYDIEMSGFVTGYVLKLPFASLGSNIKARRTEAETFPVLRFANHVLEYFDVFFRIWIISMILLFDSTINSKSTTRIILSNPHTYTPQICDAIVPQTFLMMFKLGRFFVTSKGIQIVRISNAFIRQQEL